MKTRHSILAMAACLLTLAWVSTASAAERNYWKHSDGHFENTTGNNWVEKIKGNTNRFKEVERTERYIELYDAGRDCTVRLFNDRCMVKFGNKKFEEYYNGRWGR
jgi:hypothetical protein